MTARRSDSNFTSDSNSTHDCNSGWDSDAAPLLVDAGGTHIRLARLRNGTAAAVKVYAARNFSGLEEALSAYLDGDRASAACLAAAGPADGDAAEFQFTNLPWKARWRGIAKRFGFSPLLVLNDFAALALGVLELDADEWIQVGGGAAVAGAPMAVIGPGTGMGTAALVDGRAIACEGGHIGFSPRTDFERELVSRLEGEIGGRISAERILSGPGLERIHRLRTRGEVVRTAGEILESGLFGTDGDCLESLRIFAGALGAFAGDVVLLLGARGGCYVGGGIGRRMADFLADDASGFRAGFDAKGRLSDYVRGVPVRIMTADFLPLRGAARYMRECQGATTDTRPPNRMK